MFVTLLAHTPLVTAGGRFQMALFDSDDPNYADLDWLVPSADPRENQPPAPRRSVFFIPPFAVSSSEGGRGWVEKYEDVPAAQWADIDKQVRKSVALLLTTKPYDWTRIDAVLIDEPYLAAAYGVGSSNPCSDPASKRYRRVQMMQRVLINVAAVVRNRPNAHKTRVWVNFSEPEVQWMQSRRCPVRFNDWYMDVVSLDIYGQDFAYIKPYYDYLYIHRPTAHQQLALIPGTYSVSGATPYAASTVAKRLQGFFDYAHTMNQSCSLPTSHAGDTGSADNCPIWMVAGFWGESHIRDGRAPIFHTSSKPILKAWRAQFAQARCETHTPQRRC